MNTEIEQLKSERDAALAQVVGLEFKVRSLHIGLRLLCPLTHPESEARKWADHNLTTPLPEATSAQQRVEAIRREATAELMQALRDYGRHIASIPELGIEGCAYDPEEGIACTCGLAAILGEKGDN